MTAAGVARADGSGIVPPARSIKLTQPQSPRALEAASETTQAAAAHVAPNDSGPASRKLPLPPPRRAPGSNDSSPPPMAPRTGVLGAAQPQLVDDVLDIPVEVPDPDTQVGPPIDPEHDRVATTDPAMLALPIEPSSSPGTDGRARDPSQAKLSAADSLAAQHAWRTDSIADSNLLASRSPRTGLAAFAASKRKLAIAGGAVALLVVVLVFAMSGGDSKPSSTKPNAAERTAKPSQVKKPTPSGAPSESEPDIAQPSETPDGTSPAATRPRVTTGGAAMATIPGEPPSEAPPSETPTEAPPTEVPPTEVKPVETKPAVAPRPRKPIALGGKKVVLEYDNQTRDPNPVANAPKADQAAISKARTSYAAGNTRLFAGDPDGAIRNYRQALAYYPAYVAGYRGLGLAYAQKRDKANAIKALNTYLGAVPNAKDAALIRKRVETLSK